jgi:ABC-2 type transport system permease protein
MMLSSLVRLPLIFISGVFIPLGQLQGWALILTSLSPLTYLVDLFHGALNGDAVYPAYLDILVLFLVVALFVYVARFIQQRNLVRGS